MEIYINKKSDELPIHRILQQLSLNEFLWSYDANGFYPSAVSDDKSVFPRTETGYAFTPDMNDEIVKKFNEGNSTQRSAILIIRFFNPKKLIVQQLPVKKRVKKIGINLMRIGFKVDTLTSVDNQENVKIGGKVIEIYQGVIYRENFKVFPLKKVTDKLFELRQKCKNENNDVMQLLVKLIMNSFIC